MAVSGLESPLQTLRSCLAQRPVGLVGLGLIGGSIGLDLKATGVPTVALVHRAETAERARQRGLADVVSTDPAVLREAGLVVLCLPLDRLLAPPPSFCQPCPGRPSSATWALSRVPCWPRGKRPGLVVLLGGIPWLALRRPVWRRANPASFTVVPGP